MKINFDLVRIGKKRKNLNSEYVLKENVRLLKLSIRDLLENEVCSNKNNSDSMTMIVPARGYVIKIRLQDINDVYIRKILNDRFPGYIYKGSYDTILDNSDTRVIFR
ncbi:MAG: hypothetical protein COA88_13465 [Kordia sp.]|nr:MAG: hypothetical protein COA88_13465 [Kordia sp.]